MKSDDRVFLYHSGGESKIVGLAKVVSEPRPDPKEPKSAVVDLEFVAAFDEPTSLAEIKQSGRFSDWSLVRQSRLSTMAAPDVFVVWMRERYPTVDI
jgi:predicted RNA-binding protein with PUA-like domain